MLEMRNPVASLLLILTTAEDIEMAPEAHVHINFGTPRFTFMVKKA